MTKFFTGKALLTIFGFGMVALLNSGCQPTLEVTTKGNTNIPNRFYSLAAPSDRTVILTHVGAGKAAQVEITTGRTEYDGPTQTAYHLTDGRQSYVFTQRSDQGSKTDESIEFSAQGATGRANIGVVISLSPTDESMGKFLRTYRKDDQEFIRGEFRQTLQATLVDIMRAYDPVTAVENQPKIIAELKKRLQEKYGQMLEILEVTQTNAFVFDSKAVNDAISAASEAKTRVSAVDAQVGAIKKEGEKTKAEADSFKLKTPEQRDYELKQQVVKQGGNPFQPGYPPTNLAPQK